LSPRCTAARLAYNILAIEADGNKYYDLKLSGCRPNIIPTGRRSPGATAITVLASPISISPAYPDRDQHHRRGREQGPDRNLSRYVVARHEVPNLHQRARFMGKNLKGLLPEFPGVDAPGWNVCVADAKKKNRWVAITTDGRSNKQPCWVLVVAARQPEARKD
jgi:hypothetical protein